MQSPVNCLDIRRTICAACSDYSLVRMQMCDQPATANCESPAGLSFQGVRGAQCASPARVQLPYTTRSDCGPLLGSSRGIPATGKTGKRRAKLPPERAGKAKRAPGALLAVLSAFSCIPTVSGLF